jgi:DNA-binding beta-propeller fold protein YncE
LDLRPGKNDPSKVGIADGEFPYWVTIKGNDVAYVSSARDREVVVINLQAASPVVLARIPLSGYPNRMVLDQAQTRLYVALDYRDEVPVIETPRNRVIHTIKTAAPEVFSPR